MKMTQEEFYSIKGFITLPLNSIYDFNKYPYLVNCDDCNDNCNAISNVDLSFKHIAIKKPKVYEYFDKYIFLKACDIEVEKVWSHEELEYRDNENEKWESCYSCFPNRKYRLKPQPEYSKEIESLQKKAKENGMKAIITFEKI